MDQYKIKLLNLNLILPHHKPNSHIYQLSLYIIDYLKDEHTPRSCMLAICQSLDDLYLGHKQSTLEEIDNPLVGLKKAFYQKLLNKEVQEIVTAVFPKEFAEEIKAYINHIKKLLDENKN